MHVHLSRSDFDLESMLGYVTGLSMLAILGLIVYRMALTSRKVQRFLGQTGRSSGRGKVTGTNILEATLSSLPTSAEGAATNEWLADTSAAKTGQNRKRK